MAIALTGPRMTRAHQCRRVAAIHRWEHRDAADAGVYEEAQLAIHPAPQDDGYLAHCCGKEVARRLKPTRRTQEQPRAREHRFELFAMDLVIPEDRGLQ